MTTASRTGATTPMHEPIASTTVGTGVCLAFAWVINHVPANDAVQAWGTVLTGIGSVGFVVLGFWQKYDAYKARKAGR